MSSSAREGPAVPAEKGKRLSTLVTRMKTVLKRTGSKRLSQPPGPETPSAPIAGPSTAKADEAIASAPEREPEPQPTAVPLTPTAVGLATKVNRAEIDAERARKLGERFKIVIEPVRWAPEKEAYRIEKPIRMRIHRQCHRCSTTFGSAKICVHCQHVRCTKCPRYPPKQSESKGKAPAMEGSIIAPDFYYDLSDVIELTKPNPRPGGQPLVRKKPTQRVRRTCHECSTMFLPNAKICQSCHHIRCVDCPRDPAKKKKYPDGYPGDAPSSDITRPVKYACHQCSKVYPPVPHPDSGEAQPKLDCIRCGHERCPNCPRAPPRRIEPEPDPEIVKRIEEKLAALNITTAPGTI